MLVIEKGNLFQTMTFARPGGTAFSVGHTTYWHMLTPGDEFRVTFQQEEVGEVVVKASKPIHFHENTVVRLETECGCTLWVSTMRW